jgi:hypothetical protein
MPCAKADDVWVPATLANGSSRLALRTAPSGRNVLRARATDTAGNAVSAFKAPQNLLNVKIG